MEIEAMTTATTPILIGVIAILIGTACAASQADARRLGGVYVRPHL
jgi:hypothetical protein